ncbi:MAG: hypothetical protein J6S27_04135, partial [Thermoguttaceae bacterium]|nr:hypothetical protein [Thermoguttaceae bacterium]
QRRASGGKELTAGDRGAIFFHREGLHNSTLLFFHLMRTRGKIFRGKAKKTLVLGGFGALRALTPVLDIFKIRSLKV